MTAVRSAQFGVLIATLLLGLGGVGRAQSSSVEKRAKVHFDRGQSYFEQNQYDRAMSEFEAAYKLKPIPLILFDIGNVARVAGKNDKAIDYFKRYLAVAPPKVRERSEAERWLRELQHGRSARAAATRRSDGPTPAELAAAANPETPRETPPRASEPTAPRATTPTPVPTAPAPAAAAPAATTALVTTPAPPAKTPVYKKWWLWTTLVLVVGAGVGVGLGLALTQDYSYPKTTTDLGTFRF
jgi:tetratricopeptide (TPR) repeat protein